MIIVSVTVLPRTAQILVGEVVVHSYFVTPLTHEPQALNVRVCANTFAIRRVKRRRSEQPAERAVG